MGLEWSILLSVCSARTQMTLKVFSEVKTSKFVTSEKYRKMNDGTSVLCM